MVKPQKPKQGSHLFTKTVDVNRDYTVEEFAEVLAFVAEQEAARRVRVNELILLSLKQRGTKSVAGMSLFNQLRTVQGWQQKPAQLRLPTESAQLNLQTLSTDAENLQKVKDNVAYPMTKW